MFGHPHLKLVQRLRVRSLRGERHAHLILSTGAAEEQHELARDLQGGGRAAVLFDPREREVDSRGDPGGRVEGAVLHPGRARVDRDARKAIGELSGVAPVHGRPPAVQETGFGEQESTDAHRSEPSSGRGPLSEPGRERAVSHPSPGDATHDKHGIGCPPNSVIVALRKEREAARSCDLPVTNGRDNLDLVTGASAVEEAVRCREDLEGTDEVELVHRRHDQNNDRGPHDGKSLRCPAGLCKRQRRALAEIVGLLSAFAVFRTAPSSEGGLVMLKIAFAGTFAARLEAPVRARLQLPCEIVVGDEASIVPQLSDVDVLITLAFTREMASAARRLKLVQVPGAGLDRIDIAALPTGARLANAYGHEIGIAEYVIGAMLSFTRELGRLDAALRRGCWESQWAVGAPPPCVWPELAGKTLGILGYGRIGACVARRARAFDMQICAIRRDVGRSLEDDLALLGGLEILDEVLERSDYLLIALPATTATRGLIGDKQLDAMKPTAILVNISRAQIVDEEALYRALAKRRIAGAALDVWYRYPTEPGPTFPATQPFHELPNVLMTPHVSGWTDGMLEARAALIAGNIQRIAHDEPPLNLIPR
jgi:phosphoglycerate dehydrogenase-like enzyme